MKKRKALEPKSPLPQRALNKMAEKSATQLAKVNKSAPRNAIFVVGCARSGTTLLQRLLGMHPEIADWSEANEIWDPTWYPWRPESFVRPPVEYDPQRFTEAWLEINLPRMDMIKSIFGNYQTLRNRPVFLNKTPYHTFRLPYLREHFPDAKFIYTRRDGRAVVNSYMHKLYTQDKMREWPEEERNLFEAHPEEFAKWLANYWKQTIYEIEEQDKKLGLTEKGLMLTTTYEGICEDMPGVMREVCDFIGVEADNFIESIQDQVIKNSNHKWKEKLSDASVQNVLDTIEPELEMLGYV